MRVRIGSYTKNSPNWYYNDDVQTLLQEKGEFYGKQK